MPFDIDPRWLIFLATGLAAFSAQLVWQWGEEVAGDLRGDGQVLAAATVAAIFVAGGSWLAGRAIVAQAPSDVVWAAVSVLFLTLAIVALQDARTMHVHDFASAGVMFSALLLGWIEHNGLFLPVLADIWQGILVAVGFYVFTILVTKITGKEARAVGDPLFMAAISPCMGWSGVMATTFLASVAAILGYVILHRRNEDGRFPFLPYLALAAGIVTIILPDINASLAILYG